MLVNNYTVKRNIAEIIHFKKGLQVARLLKDSDFSRLGFDNLDLVELILEVEKTYHVTIPDELALNSIEDFVDFICERQLQQAC